MYIANQTYINNMALGKYDPSRSITGTITLTNGSVINLDNSVLKTNTLNINNKCASNSLELGSACVGQCSFELNSTLFIYDLYDAEIKLYYNAWGETIPLGVYYVTEAVRQTNSWLKITGYDAMEKTDDSIGNFSTNGRAFAILNFICRNCGLELQNTEEEIAAMENSDVVLNISSNTYNTYREALKDVSAVLGGFTFINRYGKLEIKQYQTVSSATITNSLRINTSIAEYKTFISEIDANVDSIVYKATTSNNDGLTYSLSNKMIKGLVSTVQGIIDNILDAVKNVIYTPGTYDILFDPRYDLGDLITVTADGKVVKNLTKTIITSYSFTMHGTSKIAGVGESIFLAKRNKNTSASATDSANAYSKNNGTYIETYENIEAYTIGTTRKKIVSIDYGNGTADVIVLHGQACINCSTAGTIQLIYGHDGEDETFSPKHQINPGYNTIEFYCYFLEPEQNWLSTYTVDIVSEDAVGTLAIGDIRADVMATMYGNGKFLVNNVFDEQIPYSNRLDSLTNFLIGEEDPYEESEEEQNG